MISLKAPSRLPRRLPPGRGVPGSYWGKVGAPLRPRAEPCQAVPSRQLCPELGLAAGVCAGPARGAAAPPGSSLSTASTGCTTDRPVLLYFRERKEKKKGKKAVFPPNPPSPFLFERFEVKLLGSLLGEAFETTGPKERGQPLGNGSAPAPHGCPGPHRARSPRGGPAGAPRAASVPGEPGTGGGAPPGAAPPRPRVSRVPPGPPPVAARGPRGPGSLSVRGASDFCEI